ncbi:MAG: 16S rRNA (cytidine(1402)-2'-O)-methyltransferase [Rickettsiales bacterium]
MNKTEKQVNPAGLYVVSTPIGNMEDITLRAINILKIVDLVACEDTRVSGKLLSHYGIKKELISYNDHNAGKQKDKIIHAINEGKRVALISDAGTPLISDPGYRLIQEAIENNIYITAIPGASSVITSLCVSGLPTDKFFFGGFLPNKENALKKHLNNLTSIPATLIFFESARRLVKTLNIMNEIFGDRKAAISRELTKLYEENKRGTLSEILTDIESNGAPRGEIVILISPPNSNKLINDSQEIENEIKNILQTKSIKETVAIVVEKTGISRKIIYEKTLKIKNS